MLAEKAGAFNARYATESRFLFRGLQRLRQRAQSNHIGYGLKRKTVVARINDEALIWFQIGASDVKSAFHTWRGTAFDFNGPEFSARQSEDKIGLRSVGGSIEIWSLPPDLQGVSASPSALGRISISKRRQANGLAGTLPAKYWQG
jgi:hypothetical protein